MTVSCAIPVFSGRGIHECWMNVGCKHIRYLFVETSFSGEGFFLLRAKTLISGDGYLGWARITSLLSKSVGNQQESSTESPLESLVESLLEGVQDI